VLLRATRTAGKIVLKAAAENLKPAEIELTTKAFNAPDGLSRVMPPENLPVNLSRGATPSGESFKPLRRFVEIAALSAGSNSDRAKNSFDDDETTDWTSDGRPETAWIRYELAQTAKINQVVLKLVGWRTQSYPVQISVDDKVVFTGNSPRSLGYVTFSFPPTAGKSVRIALTGTASNRDAFGNIIEIPGTPDAQSAAGKGGAKNTLGVVEAEIYEPF
jgi:beta-galactosidase